MSAEAPPRNASYCRSSPRAPYCDPRLCYFVCLALKPPKWCWAPHAYGTSPETPKCCAKAHQLGFFTTRPCATAAARRGRNGTQHQSVSRVRSHIVHTRDRVGAPGWPGNFVTVMRDHNLPPPVGAASRERLSGTPSDRKEKDDDSPSASTVRVGHGRSD